MGVNSGRPSSEYACACFASVWEGMVVAEVVVYGSEENSNEASSYGSGGGSTRNAALCQSLYLWRIPPLGFRVRQPDKPTGDDLCLVISVPGDGIVSFRRIRARSQQRRGRHAHSDNSHRCGDERGGVCQSPFRRFVYVIHEACSGREHTPKDAPTAR